MKSIHLSILLFCFLLLSAAVCGGAEPLRIEAVDGGVVDLGGVTQIIGGSEGTQIVAEGEASEIRLDSVTHVLTMGDDSSLGLTVADGGRITLNADHTTLGRGVTLSVNENGFVSTGTLELDSDSVLRGRGTLEGNLLNGGTVAPGETDADTGILTVSGNFTQTGAGTFAVDLIGSQPGSGFDVCTVGGDVSLDGRVSVTGTDGYVPSMDSRFSILSASGDRSGEFSSATGLKLPGAGVLSLDYTTTGVDLVATGSGFIDGTGPVVNSIILDGVPLSDGMPLQHSTSIIVNAQDPSGVGRVSLSVDGQQVVADADGGNGFELLWDISQLSDGVHHLTITVYDNFNNATAVSHSVNIALAAPATPTIISPVPGLLVSWNTLTVTGSADTHTTVTVYNNGSSVVSNVTVNNEGQFQAVIALHEGSNSIQVSAANRGGESALSTTVVVNMNPTALSEPINFSAQSKAGGLIRLSWTNSGEASIKGYDLYRAAAAFSEKAQTAKVNTSPITNTVFDDLPTEDGLYYYRVLTVDPAGNESVFSDQASANSDSVAPKAVSIKYTPSGPYDPETGRMGPGLANIQVTLSEPLQATPFMSITPEGGVPISIDLTKSSDLEYAGFLNISETTPTGPAYAVFSARDLVGNRGTAVDSGNVIQLDTEGPAVIDLTIEPQAPIRNDETAPVSITAVIGLNEQIKEGETPELSFKLSEKDGSSVAIDNVYRITTRPGQVETWEAVFNLPADAGLAETESLEFIYEGKDDLGNIGDHILVANRFQVYQGDLPPYDPPQGLAAQALPKGVIHLTWNAVEDADGYVLYRMAPSETKLTELVRFEAALEYTDQTTSDGSYSYAVASIRQANNQEAISGLSDIVEVIADAMAPEPPLHLTLTLVSRGIEAVWEANAYSASVTYRLYRADQAEINTVAGLVPIKSGIVETTTIDPSPSDTEHGYVVTAVDTAGNESSPSNTFYLNFELLPVSALTVSQTDEALPVVSWTHSGTSIQGYDIYLGPEDNLKKLNSALITERTYTDTGYTWDERRYTLVAMDEDGHQSLGRSIILPKLRAELVDGEELRRGIMNRLEYVVENSTADRVDNVRLRVQIESHSHISETFSIEPGATRVVPVTVGGYADLPDLASVVTTIEVTPNEGEKVEISRTSEIDVLDGMMVLGLLNEEFIRGATGSVSFTLENAGEEEVEIITAGNSGGAASNEVSLFLLDADGNVLSSAPVKQNLGEGIVTLADGRTVARIPAGDVFASAPISIDIPAGAPDAVTLELRIANVHYHLGKTGQVTMDGLSKRLDMSLVDTAYYGEVTGITPQISSGNEDVIITGRAIERSTGMPLSQVPLNLTITLNGFDRTNSVYTDDNGIFAYAFKPSANESGLYKVRAIHTDLNHRPVQGSFAITRVSVSPNVINLSMAKNFEKAVPIAVSTGVETRLNNLALVYEEGDQPGDVFPEGVHVNVGSGKPFMEENSKTELPFSIWADNSAARNNTLVLKIVSDESGSQGWGVITIHTDFYDQSTNPAAPVLGFSPNFVETGVARNDVVTETVTLTNSGSAPMNNVVLALVKPDGTPAPAWVSLTSDNSFDTIVEGQTRQVGVTFSPSSSTEEGVYQYALRVQSSNYPTTNINLFVSVTQSGIGNVLFKVSDIYTGTVAGNGDPVQGLVGAKITVQNETVLTVKQTMNTDSLGEALFNDLPAGRYKCRITASNHQEYIGRFWVKPGVTVNHPAFLTYNLVSVEWEVNEITIEDRYDIVLNATYETDVPAPVVVVEPTSVSLPDMQPGDVYTGELTITNYGLIKAEKMRFELPANDAYFVYKLLSDLPDTLEAKQRITVPYRVTCIKSLTPQEDGSGGGCDSYQRCGKVVYAYECVNGQWVPATAYVCWTRVVCTPDGSSKPSPGDIILNPSGDSGPAPDISSGVSPTPKPINGLKCIPKTDPSPCDENPCDCDRRGEPPTEPGSVIHLTQREFQLNPTDLSVKVQGGTIDIERWYYGHAWHFEYNRHALRFEHDSLGNIKNIYLSDVPYEASSQGSKLFVNGTFRILTVDNGYRWETKSGNWKEFDENGRMLSYGKRTGVVGKLLYASGDTAQVTGIADRDALQVIWFDYAGDTTTVTDASGRWVDYTFTNDLLTSVKRSVVRDNETFTEERYEYDAAGRIGKIIDAQGNEKHVTYDTSGDVVFDVDANGVGKFFEYGYDEGKKEYYAQIRTSAGLVKERWFDQKGEALRLDINGRTIEKTVQDGRNRIITDENGNVTRKEYDEWNNLIKVVYPDGSSVTYEYEHTHHRRIRETNELGVVTEFAYDQDGNLTQTIEAAGAANERITEFTYDNDGNLLSSKVLGDAQTTEAVTVMTYDDLGNMTSLTDAEGNVTRFTAHDALGNVLTKVDPAGKTWAYAYDDRGRMTTMTDPLGHTTQTEYDGNGNKVQETDAEVNITRYEYDARDNLVKIIDAAKNETRYEYDTDNNRIKETDQEGKVLRYEYDNEGRLLRTIDGNGNVTTMEYEAVSAESCSSCRGGADRYEPSIITYPTFSQRFVYDVRGRKKAEYEVLSETEEYFTQYEYDPVGNLLRQIDKESNPTRYEYDALNRLVKTIDARGGETVYTYDDRDNLIALQDANGNVTRFEYDRNNRKTKEIRPMGEETVFEYDGRGNLIAKVDPKNQRTEHVYDNAGRRIETRYYTADDHATPAKTVTYAYDKVGNLLSYDDGTTSAQYVYDDLYRKTSEMVDYGPFSLGHTYAYYKNGLKQSFTGPDGITYAYRYDNNNQLAEVAIPSLGSITYNAYTWNRPASVTLPGGTRKAYTYDPLMRVKSIVVKDPRQNSLMDYGYSYDRMGNILTKSTEHGVYNYGYDNIYQLTSADNPTLPDEAFTYDLVGNRLTSADVPGMWDYNANNELLSYNETFFDYDANGNTIRKAVGLDPTTAQVTSYTYNIEDRLARLEDGSVVASYYYDPFGRRLRKDVSGIQTNFVYASEGLIAETDASGAIVSSYGYQQGSEWSTNPLFIKQGGVYYFYHNDHLGTPMSMTNAAGAAVWSVKYETFGEATIDTILDVTNNLRFPGQYYDVESGLHYNLQRYYHPNLGRYFRHDPIDSYKEIKKFYSYVSNNPLVCFDPNGEQFINLNHIGHLAGGAALGWYGGAGVGILLGGTTALYTAPLGALIYPSGYFICLMDCQVTSRVQGVANNEINNCRDDCPDFCLNPLNWF